MRATGLTARKVPPFAAKMAVTKAPICREGGTQQVNTQKVIGKVGKFNICFHPEQLTSHAGVVLLNDFAQRLGVEGLLDEELSLKTREHGYGEGQAIGGGGYNLIFGGVRRAGAAEPRRSSPCPAGPPGGWAGRLC